MSSRAARQQRFFRSHDFISGFSIFLIALPLSVGISIASGAPATAGIVSAIIGGLIGSFLGSGQLTINGPAAGLIVVVLAAINELGQGDAMTGFRRMLAATVVAGALQVIFGKLKLGRFGLSVPSSAIHGMLAAIGLIIIAKQIHVAVGSIPPKMTLWQSFGYIPTSFQHMNTEVAFIAAVSFALLLGHAHIKLKVMRFLPSALFVVVVGALFAHNFDFDHEHLVMSHWESLRVGPNLLLSVPENITKCLVFPEFSQVFTLTSLKHSLIIALIASIESLLSKNAVDRMDPLKRSSDPDRGLWSKGICNMLCGLLGGLPIIAEIARSSANVRNGAETKMANFYHGLFILLFLAFVPGVLHLIPLAALASILIGVGFHLAHPRHFAHAFEIGVEHFVAFCATVVMTLSTDLLMGVLTGVGLEVAFLFVRGIKPKDFFSLRYLTEKTDRGEKLRVFSPIVFSNMPMFEKIISDHRAKTDHLAVDLGSCTFVDHTALEKLKLLGAATPNLQLMLPSPREVGVSESVLEKL